MTKNYVSLEHSIREVMTESVGVLGSKEFKGNPSGFDKPYSSRKGGSSMAAQRVASLRKITQSRLNEKASDDKDEGTDEKSDKEKILKSPLVKHHPFVAQMMNPEGNAHPPLQPPLSQMAIPPAPAEQPTTPRDGPIPSTIPGAVPTDKPKGHTTSGDRPYSGVIDPGGTGVRPSENKGEIDHRAPVAGAAALAGLLHHALKGVAGGDDPAAAAVPSVAPPVPTTPPQREAPKLNQQNPSHPAAQQKPLAMTSPDRAAVAKQVAPPQGHSTPNDRPYSGVIDPGGTGIKPGGKTEKQKAGISPGTAPAQKPSEFAQKVKDQAAQGLAGGGVGATGLSGTAGAVAGPAAAAVALGLMAKHLMGNKSAPDGKSFLPPSPSSGQEMAGAPPSGGKLSQILGGKSAQEPAKPAPKAAAAPTKDPEQKPIKPADEDPSNWRNKPGKRTGPPQSEQPDMVQPEKGNKDSPEAAERKSERQKAGMGPSSGASTAPTPRQGGTGTQSGPAAATPPAKEPSKEPEKKGHTTPDDRPYSGGEGRDKGGTGVKPGGQTERQKAGMSPGKDEPLNRDNPNATAPKGHMTDTDRPYSGEGRDKGGTGVRPSENKGEIDHKHPGIIDIFKSLAGKQSPEQRDIYNKERDEQDKNDPKPWGGFFKKYWKSAATIAALIAANKLLGGGSEGSGGHGGGKDDRKAAYLHPNIHGHDDTWAIPTSVTQKYKRKQFGAMQQQEETQDNTKERRKVGFIERLHKHGNTTKERRKVAYLERQGGKHNRHRFSSDSLQGRETIAGMDEERLNTIMREALNDAIIKKKKGKTKVDTHPVLNVPSPFERNAV